jgi:hypothetical protein
VPWVESDVAQKSFPKHVSLQCAEWDECPKDQNSSLRCPNVPSRKGNQARQIADVEVVDGVE